MSRRAKAARAKTEEISVDDLATQRLDSPAQDFSFDPLLFRAAAGLGRPALLGDEGCALHQLVEARHGLRAVHVLAAVLLRLDHHHAGAREALVGQPEEALLDRVREGRGADVEPQVDRV